MEGRKRKTALAYRTRTALISVRVEHERWISHEIKETERDMKINNAAQGGLHDTIWYDPEPLCLIFRRLSPALWRQKTVQLKAKEIQIYSSALGIGFCYTHKKWVWPIGENMFRAFIEYPYALAGPATFQPTPGGFMSSIVLHFVNNLSPSDSWGNERLFIDAIELAWFNCSVCY